MDKSIEYQMVVGVEAVSGSRSYRKWSWIKLFVVLLVVLLGLACFGCRLCFMVGGGDELLLLSLSGYAQGHCTTAWVKQ